MSSRWAEAAVALPGGGVRDRVTSSRLADRALDIIYFVTFAIAAFLVLTPLIALVLGSLRSGGPGQASDWTLANWAGLGTSGVLGTLVTTCAISLATAVFSTIGGAVMAWIVARTDFPHKRLVTTLTGLSFCFPGFILAMAWIIIGSPGGLINGLLGDGLGWTWLKLDIYSAIGIVWIQVLHITPFTYFSVRAPLTTMDAGLEEAAYMAGATPWQAAYKVTVPLMVYPLLSSLLLSFVLAVEQFAIPAMVGIPGHVNVLATQLYLLTSFSPPNHGLAAAIGLALSALTGLSVVIHRRLVRRLGAATITGKSYRLRELRLGRWRWLAYLVCFGFLLNAFLLPVAALIYTSVVKFFVANPFAASYTLRNYTYIFNSPSTLRAFTNTLIVSAGGAVLGLTLGTLIAYSTHRLRPAGNRLLDLLATLPFGVPGIVIGLGFLWSYVYLPIYGTLWVLIFCYISRFMPYATETVGAQITQIDKSLEEAAWTAGANCLQSFVRVVLPLLRPSLQSAYFLLFISYFREIAAAVLLYTSKTALISISIWTFFENANWGNASALSVVSTFIIVAVMALVSRHVFRAA
jgi:iron(III) transport system permease protein